MEIKVRDIGSQDQKSVQEVEQVLLDKHEKEQTEPTLEVKTVDEQPQQPVVDNKVEEKASEVSKPEMSEEDVLSYIGSRYGKEIESIDGLFEERDASPELPEDVMSYFNYKKETGRGIEDFVRLNKDYDSESPESLLASYYAQTEDGLDSEDIKYLIDEKFGFDEEVDDEKDIRKRKLAQKRELSKAKKYFNDLKEKYRLPLESSTESSPKNQEDLIAYREYISKANTIEEENKRKSAYFEKQTDTVLNDNFKGFDFVINDKEISYTPASASELKKSQSDLTNFVKKYIGEDGLIKDVGSYHKALSMAMNPEKAAKFFYEQGQADAVDNVVRKSKNINMDIRNAPQNINSQDGFQVRSLNNDSGRGLKIRSIKKK
tara:strand:- start:169 stop:1293 length:1125 start_codon:yes stop_codon:yes gene_type:complete